MDKRVSIHTNRSLDHQVRLANALLSGFTLLGYDAQLTEKPTDDSDIHVVLGPHYAKQQNLGKKTILLDRAFWGDPEYISLAWMTHNGGRKYVTDASDDRPKPELKPMKKGNRKLLLLDYGMETGYPADEVRYHPSQVKPDEDLQTVLDRNDIAFGYVSTAMVNAAISGLYTIALDSRCPTKDIEYFGREQWLNNLSYMNWNDAELESGEALKHLCL